MIIRGEKKYTVTVLIRGSNKGRDGKRENSTNSITCLDTTLDEVTAIVRLALEQAVVAKVLAPPLTEEDH